MRPTSGGAHELPGKRIRRVWRLVEGRRDPSVLWIYVVKCAMHYHAHTMARRMVEGLTPVVNSY
jgi:hypothetical protein